MTVDHNFSHTTKLSDNMGLGKVAEKAICIGLTLTSFIGERADCARTVSGVASPTALTAQGPVRGFEDAHGNSVFLGIPYAATTGGANRYIIFSVPQTSAAVTVTS